MFTGNFRESTEKQQEIKDISADTFEEFLHFLYSGNLRNPNVNAEDLIIVADRYQVKDLVKVCETKLLKNINNGNPIFICSMFKRLTITLPKEYLDAPEKVFNAIDKKKMLEEAVRGDVSED